MVKWPLENSGSLGKGLHFINSIPWSFLLLFFVMILLFNGVFFPCKIGEGSKQATEHCKQGGNLQGSTAPSVKRSALSPLLVSRKTTSQQTVWPHYKHALSSALGACGRKWLKTCWTSTLFNSFLGWLMVPWYWFKPEVILKWMDTVSSYSLFHGANEGDVSGFSLMF